MGQGTMAKAKEDLKNGAKEEEEPKEPEKSVETLILEDISTNIALVKKAVVTQESRFSWRVLRALPQLRKKINVEILTKAVRKHLSCDVPRQNALLAFIPAGESPAMDETADEEEAEDTKTSAANPLEVELFLHLLILIHLIDEKKPAIDCAEAVIMRCVETKRRSSDLIASRCYFYYARAHELQGEYGLIRGTLHAALRTATLRCDDPGQAVLLNLLLRNYLNHRLVDQADLLVSKTSFPESAANSETARYEFYLGRIKSIQLDYSEAHLHLSSAIRKAPANAVGFSQTANKLAVIVSMLLGEIPDRELFRQPELRRALQPYLLLTQAVRSGDLGSFTSVVKEHADKFKQDQTYTLILRLRHNVIKTGVRMICTSYSRISLDDIAKTLQLDSSDDAEYIVAKAIRDGVIDATINHEQRFVASKDIVDVYATGEPQEAFHQRITFCLKMHNDSVKSMAYPPNAYRKYLETPEQQREREEIDIEAELADMEEEGDEY